MTTDQEKKVDREKKVDQEKIDEEECVVMQSLPILDLVKLVCDYASNKFDEDQCRLDVRRYSRLHSWYKHLHSTDSVFYAAPGLGMQPSGYEWNGRSKEETSGCHWYFLRQIDRIHEPMRSLSLQFPISLNKFWYSEPSYTLDEEIIDLVTDDRKPHRFREIYPQESESIRKQPRKPGSATQQSAYKPIDPKNKPSPVAVIRHKEYMRQENHAIEQCHLLSRAIRRAHIDPLTTKFK